MGDKINCKHHNWITAGYPYTEFDLRITNPYDVYCKDCNHFINLLSGKIIDDKGLVISKWKFNGYS